MDHKYVFIINRATSAERKIAANTYRLEEGYFNFLDADKAKLFSIRADNAITIERTDAK